MWSLYVPIHVKSWPKVKLDQVEVDSNLAQNQFPSFQEVIYAHYLRKFIWQHARFRRYSPLYTQLPRSDLCRSSNVKDHEIKWNIMYDLLYAFHVNFGHNMPDSGDTVPSKLNYLDLAFIQCQKSWGRLKDNIIIWLIICGHNKHNSGETSH